MLHWQPDDKSTRLDLSHSSALMTCIFLCLFLIKAAFFLHSYYTQPKSWEDDSSCLFFGGGGCILTTFFMTVHEKHYKGGNVRYDLDVRGLLGK
jgi:hypothetical protein